MDWPADKVERRPVADLIPYARNARTHSEAQVKKLASSMQEWGWTNPVLVDEAGMIIAGHGRVMAAQLLGYGEVPVMVAEGWSNAKKRAYVLADNRLALDAGWDDEMLALELGDLKGMDFDIEPIGFSAEELAAMSPPDFAPGTEDDQGKLDELAPKFVACPHCGKEFDLREQV